MKRFLIEGRTCGRLAFGLFSAIILVGCSGSTPPEEVEPVTANVPAPIAFDGAVDSHFVGNWVTANKGSTLNLTGDGKATMINVAPGRGTSTANGAWKVSGENLLINVDSPAGSHITRYAAKLTGDRLRLKQKSVNLDIEYRRSK